MASKAWGLLQKLKKEKTRKEASFKRIATNPNKGGKAASQLNPNPCLQFADWISTGSPLDECGLWFGFWVVLLSSASHG